jgi:hypothetical protein
VLPFVSGFAFYGWMEWHPWVGAPCNVPVWTVVTWIPFLAVPAIMAGVRWRHAGHGWPATLVAIVGSLFLTAVLCLIAFGFSFGHHRCGD